MTILLVEDDDNKRHQLLRFLRDRVSFSEIETANSYHSGLTGLLEKTPDLVLLDMTMPSFDVTPTEPGGPLRGYGGRELLEELDRRDMSIPAIVVTQFDRFGSQHEALTLDQLSSQLREQFPNMYIGTVFYNSASESWKVDLMRLFDIVKQRGHLE